MINFRGYTDAELREWLVAHVYSAAHLDICNRLEALNELDLRFRSGKLTSREEIEHEIEYDNEQELEIATCEARDDTIQEIKMWLEDNGVWRFINNWNGDLHLEFDKEFPRCLKNYVPEGSRVRVPTKTLAEEVAMDDEERLRKVRMDAMRDDEKARMDAVDRAVFLDEGGTFDDLSDDEK